MVHWINTLSVPPPKPQACPSCTPVIFAVSLLSLHSFEVEDYFSVFENSFWLVDFKSASAFNFPLLFGINTVLHIFPFPFLGTDHCVVLYYIFISGLFENGTHAMHVNILPPLS